MDYFTAEISKMFDKYIASYPRDQDIMNLFPNVENYEISQSMS